MNGTFPTLSDGRVAAAAVPGGYEPGGVSFALARLANMLGWDKAAGPSAGAFGTAFGAVVPRGARVLIKPNWVSHANQGSGGFEPLVTHAAVIRAVTEAVLAGEPASVLVADAPLQGCDFAVLLGRLGIVDWAASLQARDGRFAGIQDLRRTHSTSRAGVRQAQEDLRPLERYVLFDLAAESLLEPVTSPGRFRVTQYDPTHLARTHAPGRHQYLVAREVMDADVVINLPKLKTHKKAGITCALKNLIGINGNKEYLPHHRTGGPAEGGDCYPQSSAIKRALEGTLDRQNQARSAFAAQAWRTASEGMDRLARLGVDDLGVEGSWSGNDTIWRTCLDLNRILLYGGEDGTLGSIPRRTVLHVADAIVAGQGDGPLAPEPLPLGLLLAAGNAASLDLVGSWLLGYDPQRLPITREAFGDFRWPLVGFTAGDVRLVGDLGEGAADELLAARAAAAQVRQPEGWRDAAAALTA